MVNFYSFFTVLQISPIVVKMGINILFRPKLSIFDPLASMTPKMTAPKLYLLIFNLEHWHFSRNDILVTFFAIGGKAV